MPDLTVAAGIARGLVEVAVARGANREGLLRRARIDAADLEHQDNRVPFQNYVVLMRAAKELCGDPAFALHFGEAVDLSAMSIVGHIDHGIEIVADVFAMVNRYVGLVIETGGPSPRLMIEQDGSVAWIIDRRPNPNDFPELTESTFSRMVREVRRFFGDSQVPKAFHVTHAAPEYRHEYDRIFQVPVVFDSNRNAIAYSASWFAQRITPESPYMSRIVAAHADRLLRDLEQSKSMRGRVEQLLMPMLQRGETSMATVARSLGLSRQTLLRRLKDEGVTFAEVLDALRRTVALECLRDAKLSVNETAYRVGFSDPAPFSRAFKRWTGQSPRSFACQAREARARPLKA